MRCLRIARVADAHRQGDGERTRREDDRLDVRSDRQQREQDERPDDPRPRTYPHTATLNSACPPVYNAVPPSTVQVIAALDRNGCASTRSSAAAIAIIAPIMTGWIS